MKSPSPEPPAQGGRRAERRARPSRALGDATLAGLLRALGFLIPCIPQAIARGLLALAGAILATLAWPGLRGLRARIGASGLRVRPWSLGAGLGRNLAALLGADGGAGRGPGWLPVEGDLPPRGPLLILAAHHGSWEAGARELVRRGLSPLVLAAPWPGLPRTERVVAGLRSRGGVASVPRGFGGFRSANRHLRDGGTVVLLIDSANPKKAGRRPVAFAGAAVAAPDAAVRWARREGAALRVALAGGDGSWRLLALPATGAAADAADQAVGLLGAAVRARPSAWAWVRALALLALALAPGSSLVAVPLLSACRPERAVPPLPTDPSQWEAEADGVRWTGPLGAAVSARLDARTARVHWHDGAPEGRFDGVDLRLWDATGTALLAHVWAKSADGRWPEGPMTLRLVGWDVGEGKARGSLDALGWDGGHGFTCGGCALEAVLPPRVAAPGPGP